MLCGRLTQFADQICTSPAVVNCQKLVISFLLCFCFLNVIEIFVMESDRKCVYSLCQELPCILDLVKFKLYKL
jgi:hypothetical protein